MSARVFILYPGVTWMAILGQIVTFINSDKTKSLRVRIDEWGGKRSIDQNSALWGCAYETILSYGKLEGWEKEDLHEHFLGEYHGVKVIKGFGTSHLVPLERSSNMSKKEFAKFYSFIQKKCAEWGIDVPDPDPQWRKK